MLNITMFTDASYCPATGVGAYAVWAKCNGKTIRTAGLFKQSPGESGMAETQAVVNGLHFVLTQFQPPQGSQILAQTDCVLAINVLTQNPGLKTRTVERFKDTRKAFQALVGLWGSTVRFKHVKGHKGTVTPRNAVNTWCDKTCGEIMREARRALQSTAKSIDTAAAPICD